LSEQPPPPLLTGVAVFMICVSGDASTTIVVTIQPKAISNDMFFK